MAESPLREGREAAPRARAAAPPCLRRGPPHRSAPPCAAAPGASFRAGAPPRAGRGSQSLGRQEGGDVGAGAEHAGVPAPQPPGGAAAPEAQRAAGPGSAWQRLAGPGAASGEPRQSPAEVRAACGSGRGARQPAREAEGAARGPGLRGGRGLRRESRPGSGGWRGAGCCGGEAAGLRWRSPGQSRG